MNVFGGTGRSSRGSRGLRGLPGKEALELCNYLPNIISKSLRENEQKASFVLTSPDDCVIASKKVKTWKNKRIDHDYNFVAKTPSALSKIHASDQYALNFPGKYETGIALINTSYHPFGYFCITFLTISDESQTLFANWRAPPKPIVSLYHEITVTGSDISFHGCLDNKIVTHHIMHNCKKWTTFFLQWSATPDVVDFTYLINNDPDTRGNFHLDQVRFHAHSTHQTLGSQVDGSKPFSGQVHAVESYESEHPIPDIVRNLDISKQMVNT